MECLMTGNTLVSFTELEDCNKKNESNCSISETCCCFHQMDLNFDFDTNFSGKTFIDIPVITIQYIKVLTQPVSKNIDYLLFTNTSPPPSGYDLLKIVQVFRL